MAAPFNEISSMVRHCFKANIEETCKGQLVRDFLPHHRSAALGNSSDCKLQLASATSKSLMKWKRNTSGQRHDQHKRLLHIEFGSQPDLSRPSSKTPVGAFISRKRAAVLGSSFKSSPAAFQLPHCRKQRRVTPAHRNRSGHLPS